MAQRENLEKLSGLQLEAIEPSSSSKGSSVNYVIKEKQGPAAQCGRFIAYKKKGDQKTFGKSRLFKSGFP